MNTAQSLRHDNFTAQQQTDTTTASDALSVNHFGIYLSYLSQYLGHISWLQTDQDSAGLWETFSNSPYAKRPDMNPVVILETIRRKRAQLGVLPTLSTDDLGILKQAYSQRQFAWPKGRC